MKVSELIEKLNKIKNDIGDYQIEVRCGPLTETLTVALWEDAEVTGYIRAIDMDAE